MSQEQNDASSAVNASNVEHASNKVGQAPGDQSAPKVEVEETELVEMPLKTPEVVKEDKETLSLTEKLKKEEAEAAEKKKKSMQAWGDTGEAKQFGLTGMLKFTFPRLWVGSCWKKFIVLFNLFMVFAVKGSQVLIPIILKYAIDAIVCDRTDTGNECPSEQETYMLIIGYALVKFLGDFLNNIREIPYANMAAAAEISIAHDVYDHVQRQSLAFHLSRETGKIIRIVSKGSQSFATVLRMGTFNLLPILVEIIMTLAVFVTLFSWQFFVLQLVAIIVYIVMTWGLTEWRAKGFRSMTQADQDYNQKATDSLLNFETVKYFNAEKHEEQRFEKALSIYKDKNISVAKSLVTLNISQSLVICLGLGSTLSLANYFLSTDRLTIGGFVMFNSYNIQIYTPLGFLGTLWRWIRQNMVDVEQVLNLLEQNERIPEVENPILSNVTKGQIEFKNVSFTYDQKLEKKDQVTVIDNISFTIPAGKSVGIVGQTGSGKSTIMRLLYRFYDITSGQILIDGQDICKMSTNDLRSNIAIVPQDCVLFNDTVMYNIAYGGIRDPEIQSIIDDKEKSDELIEKIIPAAKRASIHKFIMDKQRGYYEMVGERGLKLSGGEKQRVAIARALLKQTPIMCFDEATSALDTETERQVQEAINEVSQGSTSLIIAHRLSTVRDCDIIIVLKHGVIVEQGSHNELLEKEDGYYRRLWEKQSEQQARMKREAEEKAQAQKEYEEALAARAAQ